MMTGTTSSESSDAEPHRRPARVLRQRRLPGMRRRHLYVSDSDSTSCRPPTGADQQATSNCSQREEPSVPLPQVHLLEIRTTCEASNSYSPSSTSHQGEPISARQVNQQYLDLTKLVNSSSTCSALPTEPLASASSTPTTKLLSATTCGSERTNNASTSTSFPTASNQAMSGTRASHNESSSLGCSTPTPMSSQCQLPVSEARQPQPGSVMSRPGMESLAGAATSSGQDTGPVHSESGVPQTGQRQIMRETITAVRVPMMRPNPHLLQVIRAAGGIGDVFTMRQIIHHVKNYIGQRLMYDRRNPSITYCDGDLLGQALGVKQFSILEAIGLFQRSCTPVQEYCIRTIRHLEAQPGTESSGQGMNIDGGGGQSEAVRSTTAPTPDEVPTITDSHVYREAPPASGLSSSCSSHGLPSSQSLPSSNPRLDTREISFPSPLVSQEMPTSTTDDSAMTTSLSTSQESSSCPSYTEVSSSLSSQDIGPSVSQTASQDLSQPSPPSQPSSSFSSTASTTSAVINFKAAQSSVTLSEADVRNTHSDQSSTDSSCDRSKPKPSKQENGIFIKESRISPNQARSTSINVFLDEPDGDAGAWECRVRVQTGRGPNSEGNNAAGENDNNDTVVVEYESDNFSVEYEVASSSDEHEEVEIGQPGSSTRSRNVSETSSLSSGLGTATAMLVVCKESDVEYLADYSDTDTGSDAELSEGDKWVCSYCDVKNPPFQRNCGGCWSVRSDWLPPSANSQAAAPAVDAGKVGDRCESKESEIGKRVEPSETERNCTSETQSSRVDGSLPLNSFTNPKGASSSATNINCRASLCEAEGMLAITSSSSDGPKTSSQVAKKFSGDCTSHPQSRNRSGRAASPDNKTQAEVVKAAAAASKLRAKKRHYSSGLSTSDSQDDYPKNKSQAPEITETKGFEDTKLIGTDTSVKSVCAKDESVNRSRKQRPSLYSERTLGVLSKNETCVVCLTRPKTASIIHGKTGHQVCCYHCAKKLKKQRRACPICRRPIQKVIRNYHV